MESAQVLGPEQLRITAEGYSPPQWKESYLNLTLTRQHGSIFHAEDQYGRKWVAEIPRRIDVKVCELYGGTSLSGFEFRRARAHLLRQHAFSNWRTLPWEPVE